MILLNICSHLLVINITQPIFQWVLYLHKWPPIVQCIGANKVLYILFICVCGFSHLNISLFSNCLHSRSYHIILPSRGVQRSYMLEKY